MINIEKIDFVMEQTGADYSTVRTALIISNGDVEKAILFIETNQVEEIDESNPVERQENWEQEYEERQKQNPIGAFAQDIIDVIKDFWEKGNASTLVIEKDGQTVLSLSLVVSTIGLVIAPVAAIIGLGAAFITEYNIKIILDNGEVVDVNKEAIKKRIRKEKNYQEPANDNPAEEASSREEEVNPADSDPVENPTGDKNPISDDLKAGNEGLFNQKRDEDK